MRDNLGAILSFVLVLLLGGMTWVWFGEPDETRRVLLMIVLGAVLVLTVAILIDYLRRGTDLAPDHLHEMVVGRPFERKGLGFYPAFAPDGEPYLEIFLQNRFSGPCRGRIVLTPPLRSLRFSRLPIPKINVEFEIAGQEYGVLRIPYDTPLKHRSKSVVFDVAATIDYPEGRGDEVRFRRGLRVHTPRNIVNGAGEVLFGVLLGGTVTPARVAMETPAKPLPPDATADPRFHSLWLPDEADPAVADRLADVV